MNMNIEVFGFGSKDVFYYDVSFDTFTVRRMNNNKIEFLDTELKNKIEISNKFRVLNTVSANTYKSLHENIFPEKYLNKVETKILLIEFIKKIDSIFKNEVLFEKFSKYDILNEFLLDKKDEEKAEDNFETQNKIEFNNKDLYKFILPFINEKLKDYLFMKNEIY
jgi:hypothetical protein